MPEGATATTPDDGLSSRQRRLSPALIVNTGEGKGKTTAAMGLALRAWHQGWSIGIFQFVKSGKWVSGEQAAMEVLDAESKRSGNGGRIDFFATGSGRRWVRKPEAEPDQAQAAREAWDEVQLRLSEERHDLYVLDEFTYPLIWGWLDVSQVVAALATRPGTQHVVITGRNAPTELLEIATTVTEMTKIKHPFDSGQKGQAGIEW
jgi:cob(I)alamin adenosyltransferase